MNNTNNNNIGNNVSYVKRMQIDDQEYEQEVLIKTKRQHKFKEKYFTMFQGSYMDKKLTIKDFKDVFGQKTELLFFLLNNMGTDNTIHLKQKSIAGALGINKGNLSRYIKQFEEVGLVNVVEGHICFNSQFVYKGKVEKHQLSAWQLILLSYLVNTGNAWLQRRSKMSKKRNEVAIWAGFKMFGEDVYEIYIDGFCIGIVLGWIRKKTPIR